MVVRDPLCIRFYRLRKLDYSTINANAGVFIGAGTKSDFALVDGRTLKELTALTIEQVC